MYRKEIDIGDVIDTQLIDSNGFLKDLRGVVVDYPSEAYPAVAFRAEDGCTYVRNIIHLNKVEDNAAMLWKLEHA